MRSPLSFPMVSFPISLSAFWLTSNQVKKKGCIVLYPDFLCSRCPSIKIQCEQIQSKQFLDSFDPARNLLKEKRLETEWDDWILMKMTMWSLWAPSVLSSVARWHALFHSTTMEASGLNWSSAESRAATINLSPASIHLPIIFSINHLHCDAAKK